MDMPRVGTWLALASIAASIAGSCTARDEELRRLDGRQFIAESVRGKELVPGTEIRLSFDDGQVSASAGCNSMSGPYRLVDGALHVDGLGMTAIGCDGPRHAQDEWLAQLLSARPELELDEPRLTLRSSDVTVVFLDREMASPDRPLVGTRWIGNGVSDGNVVSFGPGSETITVSFGADGEFEVFTGCVNGTGAYVASATEISFEAIGYDDALCADSRLFDQSAQVMLVLDSSTLEYELDEDTLQLHHASGRALFFRADE